MPSVFKCSSKKGNSKRHKNTKNAVERGGIDADKTAQTIIGSGWSLVSCTRILEVSTLHDAFRFHCVKLVMRKLSINRPWLCNCPHPISKTPWIFEPLNDKISLGRLPFDAVPQDCVTKDGEDFQLNRRPSHP
jgi:hypothetical protein